MLKEQHDKFDAAVAAAYGWSTDLTDNDILVRLVALTRATAPCSHLPSDLIRGQA